MLLLTTQTRRYSIRRAGVIDDLESDTSVIVVRCIAITDKSAIAARVYETEDRTDARRAPVSTSQLRVIS